MQVRKDYFMENKKYHYRPGYGKINDDVYKLIKGYQTDRYDEKFPIPIMREQVEASDYGFVFWTLNLYRKLGKAAARRCELVFVGYENEKCVPPEIQELRKYMEHIFAEFPEIAYYLDQDDLGRFTMFFCKLKSQKRNGHTVNCRLADLDESAGFFMHLICNAAEYEKTL